jgi:hypothetical protein
MSLHQVYHARSLVMLKNPKAFHVEGKDSSRGLERMHGIGDRLVYLTSKVRDGRGIFQASADGFSFEGDMEEEGNCVQLGRVECRAIVTLGEAWSSISSLLNQDRDFVRKVNIVSQIKKDQCINHFFFESPDEVNSWFRGVSKLLDHVKCNTKGKGSSAPTSNKDDFISDLGEVGKLSIWSVD